MELFGVPRTPDAQGAGAERAEDVLNLGAWFQKGWSGVGSMSEKGADFVSGIFGRCAEPPGVAEDIAGGAIAERCCAARLTTPIPPSGW